VTDPTRQRDQPALTTSSGRIWLIVGGLLALISVVVLVPLIGMPPHGVALAGAIAIVVLYAGMAATRVFVPSGRLRLGLLATGMLATAAVALAAVLVVAATSAQSLG
jgi:hypothetical protein